MKILIIGSGRRVEELETCLPNQEIAFAHGDQLPDSTDYDLIFDTTFDNEPPAAELYETFSGIAVVSAVNTRLVHFMETPIADCKLIGMNMIPTFISREQKELSFLHEAAREAGAHVAQALGWSFTEVADQVGMVTPRILFQIINEACWTLHEGTASIPDIDNAMKLGTNYPYGPFEWADRIGLEEIMDTLTALGTDDPARYRVCPLLEEKYFRGESFYPTR